MDQDHQERIRQRAHEIWESEGRPEGRDSDHWNQAEQELRDQSGSGDMSGDGMQAGDNAQATNQAMPDVAEAMAPKAAKKPRKPAAPKAKSAKSDKAAKGASTPYLNDGP